MLLPAPRPALAAPAAVTLSEFLALSSRLTGKSALDPAVANIYLTALTADPNKRGRLAGLARSGRSDAGLEREIILSWYTGIYKSGDEGRVAAYRDAVLWKATGLEAPGTCAGATGFWARPPEEVR